jgi:filamentous hemagglutinin
MAFPTSPTNGQQTTINGVIYTYSTALTAWTVTSSGGSLIASTAVSATGNITGGNILTGGLISATGNITGGNILFGSGNVSGTGNISAGNAIITTTVNATSVSASGNIRTAGIISATGNIDGGNLRTGGIVSATGNVLVGSFINFVASTGVISTTGSMSASGSIYAATGYTAGAGGSVSVAGNITGGNVLFGTGNVSGTGNIAGGYFIGNGSALTGVTASTPTSVVNGTSNVVVAASGNVTVGVAGTAAVATFATTGEYVTGAISATGNITGGNLSVTTGNITGGNILAGAANLVGNIGTTTTWFGNAYIKAVNALYADLAENYTTDAEYAPGTVVAFGGTAEITISNQDADPCVAGVVSTNPSYIMNAGLNGAGTVSVALTGRVPTSVTGQVRKGDLMVSAGNGVARSESAPAVGTVIGKALENFGGGSGTIEIVVGRT